MSATGPAAGARWRSGAIVAASVAAIAVGLVLIAGRLPAAAWAETLADRAEGLGPWGPLAYGLIYAGAVVLMVPGSALTIGAGALFGPLLGAAVALLGASTGAAIAFGIARGLGREAVARRLGRSARLAALDRAIGREGWKVVALLRLSPAVPFVVQNYAYGLTSIRFAPCLLASLVAMLPGSLLYAWLGHAGRLGLRAARGGGGLGPAGWAWPAVGIAATAAATWFLARLARRALKETEGLADPAPPDRPEAASRAGDLRPD